MYATTRITWKGLSLLLGTLLLASCGVSEPDDSPWQNVGSFSWPTTVGQKMAYRQIAKTQDQAGDITDTIKEEEVTVQAAVFEQRDMYVLSNPHQEVKNQVFYLPSEDTLLVKEEKFGADIALLSPLEKGHSWISSDDGTTYWQAEILELFAYKNVEGVSYKNVVAVKYVKHWRQPRPKGINNVEWIRFYAQGVGEILTIHNVIPDSNSPESLPTEEDRTFLVSSTHD